MPALAFLWFALVEVEPGDVTLILFANVAHDSTVEHGRDQVGIILRAFSTASHNLQVEWIAELLHINS